MQNRAQIKELKCAKEIPKCASEKRRYIFAMVYLIIKSSAKVSKCENPSKQPKSLKCNHYELEVLHMQKYLSCLHH